MQSFELASAFVNALAGLSAVIDWRAIHDAKKDIPAIPFRGTLQECWPSICHYNSQGYGIFAVIAQLDGNGRTLANVQAIRAHYVDLDNLSAVQNLARAAAWQPAPSFGVETSPGKAHVYWPVIPYTSNERFTVTQRKLRQLFDGDGAVIDAARVLRVPGTFNQKYSLPDSVKYNGSAPHLVTCYALAGYGQVYDPATLEHALAGVIDAGGGSGGRRDLGDAELAAPSMGWIEYAFANSDPNKMDRAEWVSFMSAIKQAAWTLADEATIYAMFAKWCEQYADNDVGENLKQWNSIRNTEIGWPSIVNRVPAVKAQLLFGGRDRSNDPKPEAPPAPGEAPKAPPMPAIPPPPGMDGSGPILTEIEQREYFKECFLIERQGEILTPLGRYMNSTKFNAAYGGKNFIIDNHGKTTNEAWSAATRSTLWNIPKVDHIRFIPQKAPGEIIEDALGRTGVNTYKPAKIATRDGDVSPFLHHMARVLPVESDRRTLFDYMAHNVRFPGWKIPWAPLIQSVEGVGKGVLKGVMRHCMGGPYFYCPKADELVASGSKFNAWMRAKLFILVDEIKVDERRDMIEVLKPMISEKEIEVQAKGVDQDVEDNYSNWFFLSNFKDAIPVGKNARRFAIFYSAIQTVDDLIALGMDDAYFNWLFSWLENGGYEIIAHWLRNYPIECGAIPMRAPATSSTAEALHQSRGPLETLIHNAVEDNLPGFANGYVSLEAALKRVKEMGGRTPSPRTITAIFEQMGFTYLGRSVRPFFQEDLRTRSTIYARDKSAVLEHFGHWQGYGE